MGAWIAAGEHPGIALCHHHAADRHSRPFQPATCPNQGGTPRRETHARGILLRLSPHFHVPGRALHPVPPPLPVSPHLTAVWSRVLVVWVSPATAGPSPSLLAPPVLGEPAPTRAEQGQGLPCSAGSYRGLAMHWVNWGGLEQSSTPGPWLQVTGLDSGLGAVGKEQGHATVCRRAQERAVERQDVSSRPLPRSVRVLGTGWGHGSGSRVLMSHLK